MAIEGPFGIGLDIIGLYRISTVRKGGIVSINPEGIMSVPFLLVYVFQWKHA